MRGKRLRGSGMQRNLEKRIRSKLARFAAGKLSLRDFNRWFVPATWDIDEAPPFLGELVYGTKALLDDYDKGRLSKSALRYHVSLLLDSYPAFVETEEFTVRARILAEANAMAAYRPEGFTVIRSGVAINRSSQPVQ